MIIFSLVAALLVVTGLAFLLPPLLGKGRRQQAAASRDDANIDILRLQSGELDADLAAGTIERGQYELARGELQKRVLEETGNAPPAPPAQPAGRRSALLIGLAVPLLAVGLYFLLGNPRSLQPAPVAGRPDISREQIDGMVQRLAQRLEKNPNDAVGWAMLARSYTALQRFDDAAAAFGKLALLMPNDAQVLADWADVAVVAQGGRIAGAPAKIIQRALAADPNNPKALALAGSLAFEQKDYAGALQKWRRTLSFLNPDSDLAHALAADIAEAQTLSGAAPAASAAAAMSSTAASPAVPATTLSGKVELAPALRAQVADDDTVFIFVRAAAGPRMPLVAARKQVRDLPYDFSFDDAASLSPDRKLSSVQQVVVGARISKSGDAIAKPGDVEVLSPVVSPNTQRVQLRLH